MPIYYDNMFHNQVLAGVEVISIKNTKIDTLEGRITVSRGDIFTVVSTSSPGSQIPYARLKNDKVEFISSLNLIVDNFCKVLTHQEYAENNYGKQFITNEELDGMEDEFAVNLVEDEEGLAEYYDYMQEKLNSPSSIESKTEDNRPSSKLS